MHTAWKKHKFSYQCEMIPCKIIRATYTKNNGLIAGYASLLGTGNLFFVRIIVIQRSIVHE